MRGYPFSFATLKQTLAPAKPASQADLIAPSKHSCAGMTGFLGQTCRAIFSNSPSHVYTLRTNMAACRARETEFRFILFVMGMPGNFEGCGCVEVLPIEEARALRLV